MNSTYLLGDTHGDFVSTTKILVKLPQNSTIIQLGDFGFGGGLDSLNEFLIKHRLNLMWLDGNHEYYDIMNSIGLDIHSPTLQQHHSNIAYMGRGYMFQHNNKTVMAIGGAGSIDRFMRTAGRDWFIDESIKDEDVDRISSYPSPDIILSHDSPINETIAKQHDRFYQFFRPHPSATLYTKDCNCNYMKIINKLMPSEIYHGHQHYSYEEVWNGIKCIGLDHVASRKRSIMEFQ